jgi:STE24 endopeptidase
MQKFQWQAEACPTSGLYNRPVKAFCIAFLMAAALAAQTPGPLAPVIPPLAKASDHFDALAATNAYLATVPADQKQRSDAYFEGGYWLMLWDFLYLAAVLAALLASGLSARMRNLAERISKRRLLVDLIYWVEYLLVTSVACLPLTVYEGFFREHQYGLSNQDFAGWMGDQLKGLMVGLILGGLAVAALFAVVRRLRRTWHIWGAAVAILFLVLSAVIGPVFIAPLFNQYTILKEERIKQRILRLARANGIPVTDVYEFNASKQSKRVSANVSGFLGTTRISLNDNLLNRCSPEAIEAVLGHEMGHYVMNHVYKSIMFSIITLTLLFVLLRRSLEWSLGRWGTRWKLRAVDDVAVLPLAVVLLSLFSLAFTPLENTFTRTQEFEADMYGFNAARQPDGEAEADLLLGEYRKLDPGPVEEWIFFDHPSGRTRIFAAMRWKAENLALK